MLDADEPGIGSFERVEPISSVTNFSRAPFSSQALVVTVLGF